MLGKLIDKLRKGLTKTREGMVQKIREVLRRRPEIDEETLEEIEEILIEADVGVEPTLRIIDQLRERFETGEPIENPETAVQEFLEEEIRKILLPSDTAPSIAITAKPHVILVVGVNGVGKTTTIGKMATNSAAKAKKYSLPPETHFGQRPLTSSASGQTARDLTSCNTNRAQTQPPWHSTPFRQPAHATSTS